MESGIGMRHVRRVYKASSPPTCSRRWMSPSPARGELRKAMATPRNRLNAIEEFVLHQHILLCDVTANQFYSLWKRANRVKVRESTYSAINIFYPPIKEVDSTVESLSATPHYRNRGTRPVS